MAEVNTKQKIVEAVDSLPEQVTLDDAIERLIFLRKVERGLEERRAGEGIPQEEVEEQFRTSWQT